MAPARIELTTNGLGNRCSIQLSYGASFDFSADLEKRSLPVPSYVPFYVPFRQPSEDSTAEGRCFGVMCEYRIVI